MTRRKVMTSDVREWKAAHARGECSRNIAHAAGRCPKTVKAHLLAAGLEPATYPTTKAKILKLWTGGAERWAIADALGISLNHVGAVVSRAKRNQRTDNQ